MIDGKDVPGEGGLRLRLVGTFGVFLSGRQLRPGEVGSRKARTVLALLAVRRDQFVHVDDLVRVLWSERPPRQARQNVATLVSRLRSVLGRGAVVGGAGAYRLGPAVTVDVDAAATLVRLAEQEVAGNDSRAVRAARQALELLGTSEVLMDYANAPWAESVRVLPAGLARRARLALAEAALRRGDEVTARSVAARAVADDALDEPAHRALMRAHAAAGEPARALAVYERLRRTLADELGIDPAPATNELYLKILRTGAVEFVSTWDLSGLPA